MDEYCIGGGLRQIRGCVSLKYAGCLCLWNVGREGVQKPLFIPIIILSALRDIFEGLKETTWQLCITHTIKLRISAWANREATPFVG